MLSKRVYQNVDPKNVRRLQATICMKVEVYKLMFGRNV